LGPFTVHERVSPYAYKLELTTSGWTHQEQLVSPTDPVVNAPLLGQPIEPTPQVETDSAKEYQLSGFAVSSMNWIQLLYLIHRTWYDVLTTEPAKSAEGLNQWGRCMEYTVRSLDCWEAHSEDLSSKKGILSQRSLQLVIGNVQSNCVRGSGKEVVLQK